MITNDYRVQVERLEMEIESRSIRPDVRNPVLALPAARRLAKLLAEQDPAVRAATADLLRELSESCRAADKAWRTHKAPMAAYWKAQAVYFRHIRLALRA